MSDDDKYKGPGRITTTVSHGAVGGGVGLITGLFAASIAVGSSIRERVADLNGEAAQKALQDIMESSGKKGLAIVAISTVVGALIVGGIGLRNAINGRNQHEENQNKITALAQQNQGLTQQLSHAEREMQKRAAPAAVQGHAHG